MHHEIIQIAVGDPACEVATHVSNLQGLAITTTTTTNSSSSTNTTTTTTTSTATAGSRWVCQPDVTHVEYQQLYVPRILLVEHETSTSTLSFNPVPSVSNENSTAEVSMNRLKRRHLRLDHSNDETTGNPVEGAVGHGRKKIERVDLWGSSPNSSDFTPSSSSSLLSSSSSSWDAFWKASNDLAYSPYSRYRITHDDQPSSTKYGGTTTTTTTSTWLSKQADRRHVDWDAMEEDEPKHDQDDDDDEDDDLYERKHRRQTLAHQQHRLQQAEWHAQTYLPLQQQLDGFWNYHVPLQPFDLGASQVATTDSQQQVQVQQEQQQRQQYNPGQTDRRTSSSSLQPTTFDSVVVVDQGNDIGVTHWTDYWMPPHHPNSHLRVPFGNRSDQNQIDIDPTGQSYLAGSSCYTQDGGDGGGGSNRSSSHLLWTNWWENDLIERIRTFLEVSDTCQGFVLYSSSTDTGFDDGLTTALLQYIHDECPTSRSWLNRIEGSSNNHKGLWETTSASQRVRIAVQTGLAWYDQMEQAHAIMPLQGGSTNNTACPSPCSSFLSSAWMAAAWEAITLPFRLSPSSALSTSSSSTSASATASLALNSFCGGSTYHGAINATSMGSLGAATHVNLREFVRMHVSSSQHKKIMELDMMWPTTGMSTRAGHDDGDTLLQWYDALRQGTSVDRQDARMRPPSRVQGIVSQQDPGLWLQPAVVSTKSNIPRGLLSCWTPQIRAKSGGHGTMAAPLYDRNVDRSLHHHFALSSALRLPNTRTRTASKSFHSTPHGSDVHQYTACLMEGMGLRYRPEQSMATSIHQSLAQVTDQGYGAGSYWKHIYNAASHNCNGKIQNETPLFSEFPVLAVMSNSTRIFPFLHQVSTDMQHALSPKMRGWFQREVQLGMLLEYDDCQEALASCLDIRDSYHPPDGSGLGIDTEEWRQDDFV